MIYQETIKVLSRAQIEFLNITKKVEEIVKKSKVGSGQVLVYAKHTTAGIIINHDESLLKQDLARLFYRLVPVDEQYNHDLFELRENIGPEERSNGHAHSKQVLIGPSQVLPIEKGKLILNPRQSIMVVEFDGGRTRDVVVQVLGE